MTGHSAQKTEELLITYARHLHTMATSEPVWMKAARAESANRFAAMGIPSPRLEAWKYTNLRELIEGAFVPVDSTPVASDVVAQIVSEFGLPKQEGRPSPVEVVIHNGQVAEIAGADVSGVKVVSLAHMLEEQPERLQEWLFALAKPTENGNETLVSLNNTLFTDGVFVEFLPNAVVEQPVHLVFCGAPASGKGGDSLVVPRVVVVAGRGSVGTVVESFVALPGTERLWSNPVVECFVEEGALLHHVKVQAESAGCFHTAATEVRLAAHSGYRNVVLTLGGGLVRNDLRVTVDGSHVECGLYGATLVSGRQHVDHHTWIDHRAPESTSEELYRAVVDDRSRVVFNGAIVVQPGAQKTNARQTNNNLLLSQQAHVDTKPELLIYADDVKCAHGATVGELDELSLFYLRARGIPDDIARGLLLLGFLREVVDKVPNQVVQETLHHQLAHHLPGASNWLED